MNSSPLATLPIEFCSSGSWTSWNRTNIPDSHARYAVTLVSRKLDNPKGQKELWFEFDLDESRALSKQLSSWKSLTARYVAKESKRGKRERQEERRKRKEEKSRQQWQLELRRWESEDCTCENYGLPNDDDPDL
jgi:hypothetical protein